jgi:hypothetical protein
MVVPLSELGSPATIKRVNLQDESGAPQPVYYLDDLALVSAGALGADTAAGRPSNEVASEHRLLLPVMQ